MFLQNKSQEKSVKKKISIQNRKTTFTPDVRPRELRSVIASTLPPRVQNLNTFFNQIYLLQAR